MLRVNSDLVGKYINIASRAAGFISKRFGGRCRRRRGPTAARCWTHLRAWRPPSPSCTSRARVRQGAARDHAAGRPRERLRGPATSPGSWPSRAWTPPARRVHRVHRGLPPAHASYLKPVAGAGRAGRGLPEGAAADLRRRQPRWAPHHRRIQAPDAARGPEAARSACSSPQPGKAPELRNRAPAARNWRPRSPSTTSPRSTCASPDRQLRGVEGSTKLLRLTLDVGEGARATSSAASPAPTSPRSWSASSP
jgi:methionyl-tRNA synthetase